jgi:hypothetical protein
MNPSKNPDGLNCIQRLCLRSGGILKGFTVPRDQTLNEDSTLNLHHTPPLRKHFVGGSVAFS